VVTLPGDRLQGPEINLARRARFFFFFCSGSLAGMKTTTTDKNPRPLSRRQAAEAMDQLPLSEVLGPSVTRGLTHKQKEFAHHIARGETGAQAYRLVYSKGAKPMTAGNNAQKLKRDTRVITEAEAYRLALEGEKQRTPAALRALVIKTLVDVMINPETPPAVKINAAKVAGQITEVSAFTERTEVRTISSSEDAKAKIFEELRRLSNAQAVDVDVIRSADSLLDELNAAAMPEPIAADPADEPTLPTPHPPLSTGGTGARP